jgi:phosphoribosylpyrophosphate synthetase
VSDIDIHYLPTSASDGKRLALQLGVSAHEITLHHFPDGEMRVTVGPATFDGDCLRLAPPTQRQTHRSLVCR